MSNEPFNKYMVLQVKDSKSLEGGEIPDDASVTDSNSLPMLFGLQTSPPDKAKWTWRQIKNQVKDLEEAMWVKELGRVMEKGNQGITFPPIQSVFQSPRSGKIYIPSLHSLDVEADGSRKFYILFVEQPTWAVVGTADERFSTLLSCLMLGNRLQWELCIHYLYELDNQKVPINEIYRRLKEVLMDIEEEGKIRKRAEFHQGAPERLAWVFDIEDVERGEVEKNLVEQNACKLELMEITEEQNINKIKELLQKLLDLNNRLMSVVCKRYQQLIDKMYTEEDWVRTILGQLSKRKAKES